MSSWTMAPDIYFLREGCFSSYLHPLAQKHLSMAFLGGEIRSETSWEAGRLKPVFRLSVGALEDTHALRRSTLPLSFRLEI